MMNMKTASNLRKHTEELHNPAFDSSLSFAQNRRGCYMASDMSDYEKSVAMQRLAAELSTGRKSGEEKGWILSEQVRNHFNMY